MPFGYSASLFVILMLLGWFVVANYISLILHRAIAHRAIILPRWWMMSISFLSNAFYFHVNPRTWVADHRMHHAYSDTEKDPDKHPQDHFWGWFVRFLKHNPSADEPDIQKFSKDDIFDIKMMRFLACQTGGVMCQITGVVLPCLVFWSIPWGLAFWLTIRLAGIAVLSFQSYFAHSGHLGFGYQTYRLGDQSANLTHPIPLVLTAGECLQNNHHAKPRRASHAHLKTEWDPGFMLVRLLVRVGIATVPEQEALVPEQDRRKI